MHGNCLLLLLGGVALEVRLFFAKSIDKTGKVCYIAGVRRREIMPKEVFLMVNEETFSAHRINKKGEIE